MRDINKFIFEDLEVYQKSLKFSIEVCRLMTKLPYKYQRISDQLIGASISIPLNIAEGNGRGTSKEKINFYKIARSSSFECIPLIEILKNLSLINLDQASRFREEIKIISSMISGLISYQRDRQ